MTIEELSPFYLVGGTALALIFGHRDSVDIDLFTHQDFDAIFVEETLSKCFEDIQVMGENKLMLFTYVNNIKVDFVNNRTTLFYPINIIDGIRIADEKDIAVLKLKAIFQLGSRKDFVDLHLLLQHYSIKELISFFSKVFPKIDTGQLLLSMQYFGDAEDSNMPEIYTGVSWSKIKKDITKKVIDYIKA